MSVSGAGVRGEIARGSPAHLAAAIKDDSTYKKRLAEIKTQRAKIALAGRASVINSPEAGDRWNCALSAMAAADGACFLHW
jgi:hypothetical protein